MGKNRESQNKERAWRMVRTKKRKAMKKITQDKTRQKKIWQAHKDEDSNDKNEGMTGEVHKIDLVFCDQREY